MQKIKRSLLLLLWLILTVSASGQNSLVQTSLNKTSQIAGALVKIRYSVPLEAGLSWSKLDSGFRGNKNILLFKIMNDTVREMVHHELWFSGREGRLMLSAYELSAVGGKTKFLTKRVFVDFHAAGSIADVSDIGAPKIRSVLNFKKLDVLLLILFTLVLSWLLYFFERPPDSGEVNLRQKALKQLSLLERSGAKLKSDDVFLVIREYVLTVWGKGTWEHDLDFLYSEEQLQLSAGAKVQLKSFIQRSLYMRFALVSNNDITLYMHQARKLINDDEFYEELSRNIDG